MRWKIGRTLVALTCALAVLILAMKTMPAAAATMEESSAQQMAATFDMQIDKVKLKVLAMAPDALGGIAPEVMIAQIKAGDIVVMKKMLVDELHVAKIRQPLTRTEVAITAFAPTAEPFAVSMKSAEYSDEMKVKEIRLAGFTLAKTPMAFVPRC